MLAQRQLEIGAVARSGQVSFIWLGRSRGGCSLLTGGQLQRRRHKGGQEASAAD